MTLRPAPVTDLTGDEVRAIFEELLPADEIEAFAREVGHLERRGRVDVVLFCRAAVIAANTPSGGMQADAMRAYERVGGKKLARSSWYQRFDESFERLMAKLAERALALARAQELDLPGILGGVTDWLIVDSTTAKMRDALAGDGRLRRSQGASDGVRRLWRTHPLHHLTSARARLEALGHR